MHNGNCHTIHIEGGGDNVARASLGCLYATCIHSTPVISMFHFDKQVGDCPLALRTITEWLTDLRQDPKSELGTAAAAEAPDEQQGKRQVPARRSPAILPVWGWCDPGKDIATNIG